MELKSDERLKQRKPMYNRVLAVILTRPWCPIVIPSKRRSTTSLHIFKHVFKFWDVRFFKFWNAMKESFKENITQSYPICHIHETDAGCVARMFLHLHNLGRSFHLASSPARRGRTSLRWKQRSLSRIVWQMEGLKKTRSFIICEAIVRPLWIGEHREKTRADSFWDWAATHPKITILLVDPRIQILNKVMNVRIFIVYT
jgi:hypothetical protein